MKKLALLAVSLLAINASAFPGYICNIECSSTDEVTEFFGKGKAREADKYSACETAEAIAQKNAFNDCLENSPVPSFCEHLPNSCKELK